MKDFFIECSDLREVIIALAELLITNPQLGVGMEIESLEEEDDFSYEYEEVSICGYGVQRVADFYNDVVIYSDEDWAIYCQMALILLKSRDPFRDFAEFEIRRYVIAHYNHFTQLANKLNWEEEAYLAITLE